MCDGAKISKPFEEKKIPIQIWKIFNCERDSGQKFVYDCEKENASECIFFLKI